MTPRALAVVVLLATPLLLPIAAAAQQAGLTLAQVERKYPRMSPVHIEKCDRNGDEIFTRPEMACVQGIYEVMYKQR